MSAPAKTDAKAFFANERTFLHWMSTSVTVGSIAAALSGVAGHAHRTWGDDLSDRAIMTRFLALGMLLVAIIMALWGGYNFQKRAVYLENKMDGPYDSWLLPRVLTAIMMVSMGVVFAGALMHIAQDTPNAP